MYEVAPGYLTTLKHDFYFQVRQNVSLVWSNKLWIFCWSVSLSQLKALPGLDAHVLGKRKLSSSHKRIREGMYLSSVRIPKDLRPRVDRVSNYNYKELCLS